MKEECYPFVMRPLPYEYYALAPYLSAETLKYHHDRHYKNYVDKLNQTLSDYPNLQKKSLTELLAELENLPQAVRISVKNNGGGVFNHQMYFDGMQSGEHQDPKGALLDAILRDYGSLHDFKERLKLAAVSRFGSGYAWLVLEEDGTLQILTTANQNVPNLKKEFPILVIDVWEHAYYLQYQNRREEYVDSWLRLINWRKAALRYEEALEVIRKGLQDKGVFGQNLEIGSLPEGSVSPERTSDNA